MLEDIQMNRIALTSLDLLKIFAVPNSQRVFVLPTIERPSRIMSQQRRALNVVHAQLEAGLFSERGIAIIGGGFGGLTAAAYAATQGIRVHVFEKEEVLFKRFRKSERYIHPRLYDWPSLGWSNQSAGLPVLNWEAGYAKNVVHNLDVQLNRLRSLFDCKITFQATIDALESGPDSVCLRSRTPAGYASMEFDVVLTAVGFGAERTLVQAPHDMFPQYWDAIPPESLGDSVRLFVLGNGDGALADLIGLAGATYGKEVRAGDFTKLLMQLESVREEVEHLEDQITPKMAAGIPFDFVEYEKRLRTLVTRHLRLDCPVEQLYLKGRSKHYLDIPGTYAANRALFAAAFPTTKIHYNGNFFELPKPRGVKRLGPFVASEKPNSWVLCRRGPSNPLATAFPSISRALSGTVWQKKLSLSERPISRVAWSLRAKWVPVDQTGNACLPRLVLSTEWTDPYIQRVLKDNSMEDAVEILRGLLRLQALTFEEILVTDAALLDGCLLFDSIQSTVLRSSIAIAARAKTLAEAAVRFLLDIVSVGKWRGRRVELSSLGGKVSPIAGKFFTGSSPTVLLNQIRGECSELSEYVERALKMDSLFRGRIRQFSRQPMRTLEHQFGLLESLPEIDRDSVPDGLCRTDFTVRSRVFEQLREVTNQNPLVAREPAWLPLLVSWYNTGYNTTIARRNGATASEVLWSSIPNSVSLLEGNPSVKGDVINLKVLSNLSGVEFNMLKQKVWKPTMGWHRGTGSLSELLHCLSPICEVEPINYDRQQLCTLEERLAQVRDTRRLTVVEWKNAEPDSFAPLRAIQMFSGETLISTTFIGK